MRTLLAVSMWLVLFFTPAYAQQEQVLAIQDFTPGLNQSILPDIAPPGTFTTLQNFILTKPGRLQKRWAFTHATKVQSGSGTYARNIYVWDRGSTATSLLLTVSNGDSVRVTADSTWTGLSRKISGTQYDFAPFNGKLIITGNTDSAFSYTGSGSTLTALSGGAPVNGSYVRNYKNYLWIANGNTGATDSRLWFSNLGDQTTWGANDYIDVFPYDGDQIMALEVFGASLIIFKQRAIYVLTGDAPSNFIVQQIVSGIGCLNYKSVRVVDGQMFFLALPGIFAMSDAGIENISGALSPLFDESASTAVVWSSTLVGSAVLGRYKQYWILLPVSSSSPVVRLFVYQYDTKAWAEFTSTILNAGGGVPTDFYAITMTCGIKLGTQPAQTAVYIAGLESFRIFRYPYESTTGDVTPDSTITITSTATFAPLQGAMPHMQKQWRYLYMTAITTAADTISVSGINTTQTYTMSSGTNRFRVPLDTRSKALGVTITHATRAVADLGNFLFTYTLQQFEQ